jgi:2,4-dienoyl-CoA reductase-like NADH-dependent reductase (Old Yellow Enzyme family)
VGDSVAVTAKLNMSDGVRGGLEPGESLAAARLLAATGRLDALQLTGGGSQLNQMFMFRGDPPRKEFAAAFHGTQRLGFQLAGRVLFRRYPFEEAYFLPLARQFRDALTLPLTLLGGISSVESIQSAMRSGFDFVAMGRALLREPDLVARMQAGTAVRGTCTHCNKCIPSIYTGTRCVLDFPEPITITRSRADALPRADGDLHSLDDEDRGGGK